MRLPGSDIDIDLSMYSSPWLIDPMAASRIIESLAAHDWTEHVRAYQAARSQQQADGQQREPQMHGKVAVIEISGVMSKHGSSLSESGSTVAAREALRQARKGYKDGKVSSVVIRWDTPGGTVAGTAEFAADIRKTAAMMPVISVGEDMVASAGIWGASQANKFYLSSSTTNAGSLGAVLTMDDVSEAFKEKGIKIKVYATGPYKGAGIRGVPITKAQDDYFQEYVQKMFAPFAADFKASRKMSDEQFQKIADGRVFVGEEAVSLGLVDGIKNFEEVLAEAETATLGAPPKGAKVMAENERKAASLADLEMIAGATPEFVVKQLKAGATLEEAKAARVAEREAEVKAKDEALKLREAELAKKETDAAATKPDAGKGVDLEKPVDMTTKAGDGKADDSGVPEPIRKFAAAKKVKIDMGMKPEAAHAAVCEEDPALARAYMLAEHEAYKKRFPNRAAEQF